MTKQQAVEQLIDAAIRAYEAGEHAVAITLAGAAEGAMPEPEPTKKHLFTVARDAFTGYAERGGEPLEKRHVVTKLNAQRDWLKHYNSEQPAEMNLNDSIMAIFRVMSKFQAVYVTETSTMQEFFAAGRAFDPADG